MAPPNPTIQSGSGPKPKMWHTITRRILDLLAANVTIVVSPPFLKDQKWSLLYGDHRRYRIHEYPDARTAWREFRAIENVVLLDCGSPSSDFHLLDSQDAAKVVDLESYQLAVGRSANYRR